MKTEHNICEEQCASMIGRGCVNQIFSVKQMVLELVENNRKKLYLPFMDLEKAYDLVDGGLSNTFRYGIFLFFFKV